MADPSWYPDPTGRFELRYFDGVQWTAHVATGGVTNTDPLPEQQAPVVASTQTDAPMSWPDVQGPGHQPGTGQPSPHGSYPPQDVWQPSEPASSGQRQGALGLLAALTAIVLLVAGGLYLLIAGRDDATPASTAASTSTTMATAPSSSTAMPAAGLPAPTDPRVEIPEYGSDPEFDGLADGCQGGDMGACDTLYRDSALGSGYEAYGDSCGGRNEPAGYCVAIYRSS